MARFLVNYIENETSEHKHALVAAVTKEEAARIIRERAREQEISITVKNIRKHA